MLELSDVLKSFMEKIKQDIIENQKSAGSYVSGDTSNSIYVEATASEATLYGSIAVNVLETGRKPGKTAYNFRQIIEKWIKDKGIFSGKSDREIKTIAYFISKKIREKGTRRHLSGKDSGIITKAIEKNISNFEIDITRKFGVYIDGDIKKTFNSRP